MLKKRVEKERKVVEELELNENNEKISEEARLQIQTLRNLRESSIANKTKSLLTFITEKEIKKRGLKLVKVFDRILQVLIRTEGDGKVRVNLITLSGDRKKLGNIDRCYIISDIAIYNDIMATPFLGYGTYYRVYYLKDKSVDERYLSIIRYIEEI